MKCSSIKTVKLVAFRRPHPVGNFCDLFFQRQSSLGGKSLKYRASVTIINRSNYTYKKCTRW